MAEYNNIESRFRRDIAGNRCRPTRWGENQMVSRRLSLKSNQLTDVFSQPALILEFFQRGAKLEDASNRYQHTCKACGEKFPKGRIDSLTTHLVKKCPAISLRDRQKALLELNNLPADLADSARNRNGEVQMNGPTVELPLGNRNWTALETLAEVSRQIDLSEKHDDRSTNNKGAGSQTGGSEPPRADRLELQEQYTLDNPPVSYEQRVQRDKKSMSPFVTIQEDLF